jgi:hypothetical protein
VRDRRLGAIVIEQFGTAMRKKLTTGDVLFRKAYPGFLDDRIEVGHVYEIAERLKLVAPAGKARSAGVLA